MPNDAVAPIMTSVRVVRASDVPSVTREQMREVDRLMIEEYGVQLLQMMENAGLQLATLTRMIADQPTSETRVTVLAGRGNNSGGGLTAARRLHAWGVAVQVALAAPAGELGETPALQLAILQKMGVPVRVFDGALPDADVIVDAVIGYSLSGAPRGAAAVMIAAANESPARVVSLDVPSGVDVDSGNTPGDAIDAVATVTLALPKPGLLKSLRTGDLYLADISVPPELYARLGLAVSPALFADAPLVRIET